MKDQKKRRKLRRLLALQDIEGTTWVKTPTK